MKKAIQLAALALLVSVFSCDEEKTEDKGVEMGNLYVSNSKPQAGDEIFIKYPKTDSIKPEAIVNYLVGNDFYPEDIELRDSAEAYYGKISIPDSVHAIALNFKKDDVYDTNNSKGYVVTLYNDKGEEIPRSLATKGVYLKNGASLFDLEFNKDSAFSFIDEAISKDPSIREDFDEQYSNALLAQNKEKADAYIAERIEYYSKKDSLSSANYSTLSSLYRIKKADAKADSISKIAISKYPKSQIAKRDLMMKVVQSPEIDEKIEHFNTYEKEIGVDGYEKDIMLRFIANAYAEKQDWENFKKYASQMDDPLNTARIYNSVAWELAEKGENLDFADEISNKSLAIINGESVMAHKPNMYSEKQFENSLEYGKARYADTYALIKYKKGDLAKAIEIQENAISEKSSADANTRFIKFLTEAEQYEKALKKAEKFMKDNRASAEMEEYMETAFKNKNPDKDFDSYLALVKEAALTNQRNQLKKEMLDEKAPSFKLKDLDGREISLASLKGKTVILDFWATWCGPCIQSFPGMQRAVEKYQDYEDVEFFFVNTWENGENRKKEVSDFIEKNNYSFHVLMDEPVAEGSREFSTISDYKINGIPSKIIIGPEGNINFKSFGYDGNNAKLLQEIGLMIELTQKSKEPQA